MSVDPNDPRGVIAAARLYCSLGWYPVRLYPHDHEIARLRKACVDDDWLERVYLPEDFQPGDNIGIRLVASGDKTRSKKIVGVDIDCDEAVAVAPAFLPPSNAAWGRKSKSLSQVLYESPFAKSVKLTDDGRSEKNMIIEIRCGKEQSMAPPSTHPNGEVLQWRSSQGPIAAGVVPPAELERAVQLIATCAMVARYYNPPGARHDWGVALAGTLKLAGIKEDEARKIIVEAARFAGDPEVEDRKSAVRGTYARSEDNPLKAGKALKELMKDGAAFLSTLRKIWKGSEGDFIRDDKDKVIANNQTNIRRALEKDHVTLFHDIFAQRMFAKIGDEPARSLDDAIADRLWLGIEARYGFRPNRDYFDTVVKDTARKTEVHPVRDYLKALTWDGTPRIDTWLIDYAGAADSAYVRAVSSMVLVAAVRRVMKPGCKFDELMILESTQGWGKSTSLRILCPNQEWFSDDLPLNVTAKEVIERTSGKWIIEAAELSGMRKSQVEALKSLLSRQVDGPVRLAYARLPVEVPRQFISIGTTNSHAYLKDSTGNRRFWPLRVERVNVDGLASVRDQLWAEAAFREKEGASIRLDPTLYAAAEQQQERRREEDAWEPDFAHKFGDRSVTYRVTPDDLWDVIGIPMKDRDERATGRIASIMQRLGFRRIAVRPPGGKPVVKGWGRDADPNAPTSGGSGVDGSAEPTEAPRRSQPGLFEGSEGS